MQLHSLLWLGLGLTFLGCTDEKSIDPYACEIIAEACHGASLVSAIAAECHELGHDGELADCAARRDECVSACAMIDASVPEDASYGDADEHQHQH